MSSTDNRNGNGGSDHDSPLDAVVQRITERQQEEAAAKVVAAIVEDPVYGWKDILVGAPVSLEQLHAGLIAVSQIAEAAIEGSIKMAADLKQVLPALEAVSGQLKDFMIELSKAQSTLNSFKRDIQSLKDDTRDLSEKVRLVPAMKRMLADVLTRLPEDSP